MTDLDEDCIHGLGPVSACVLCNGRAKREEAERWEVGHWFTARYAGTCARCQDSFEPGDRIGVTDRGEYICDGHR